MGSQVIWPGEAPVAGRGDWPGSRGADNGRRRQTLNLRLLEKFSDGLHHIGLSVGG